MADNIKRPTVRFNLNTEKGDKAWTAAESFKKYGYDNRNEFIIDAIVCFDEWLQHKRVVVDREEIEIWFKSILHEVLEQSEIKSVQNPIEQGQHNPDEYKVNNEMMSGAIDFLSTL